MNACSIKGTSYEKEYRTILSEPAMIFVWNANNEQPLDKRKVGNEVIDNPLYQQLLEHPITKGNRVNALKLVAQSFLPMFTKNYTADESGNYSLEQVLDYVEKKQKQVQDQREQIKASINLPTSMAINFPNGKINGETRQIYFSAEQGQEIYDSIQYLLGQGRSWAFVYQTLVNQRNTLLARIQENKYFSNDPLKLASTETIIQNFEEIKSWYNSKDGLVSEEMLEDDLGDSEDWKTKDKSQSQRASSKILGMVASLPMYRTAIPGEIDFETGEEYQETTQVELSGELLGLPRAGDFQKNWSLLGASLSGLTSYSEMYKAIENLASRYPQFSYLLAKIPNPNVAGSAKTLSQILVVGEFKRVFSVPDVSSVVLDVTRKEDGKIATTQQSKGFQPIRNVVALYDSQYFSYNQKYLLKGLEGNELNVEALVEDFAALFRNLGSAFVKKIPMENFIYGSRVNEFSKFLQGIGFGLSNQDYLRKDNEKKTSEFIIANLSGLKAMYEKLKLVSVINSYLSEEDKIRINKPISFLRDTIQEIYEVNREIKPQIKEAIDKAISENRITYQSDKKTTALQKVIRFLNKKETEIKPLITFFTQFDAEFRPSSYLNAEDKKKFIRGPWFYMTQQTNVLNKVSSYEELISTPGFERFDYRKNPDILGSIWLERMFGLPRTKSGIEKNPLSSYVRKNDVLGNPIQLNITNFDGTEIKNFGAKSGKTTTNQHPGDKIFQDFASFFQSLETENVRFGDKTSAFSVKSSNPVLAEKIYIAINSNELLSPTDRTTGEDYLTDVFKAYLASEVNRLVLLLEEKGRGTTYDRLGKNLFIFSDIIPELTNKFKEATSREELIELYAEAVRVLPNALQEYFKIQSEKLVEKLVDVFTTPVNLENGVAYSANQRLKETAAQLTKLNIINSQLLPQELRNTALVITPENIKYIAELYLKNGFIENVEFLKMFVGDLSNFDKTNVDAREIFKRIPFTSSPGNVVFWDESLEEFFTTDENQDALSKAYTGISNSMSPVVRTVIYNDVNSFSKESYEIYQQVYDSGNWDTLTEEEKSEFIEYTNKPKEADAQGVVTLDFYRNYLIGLGGNRWSAEQELAYNKQVRVVLINKELANNPPNAEELYKEKSEIMQNFGSALFPPLKLGHYGPVVEDPKLTGLHKFSLIPLIPTAIEGKQLEKQLELMYKNKINYYTFKSGSKMAQYGEPINFYKEVTNASGEKVLVVNDALSDNNVTSIHLSFMREQQYQAPKFKGSGTLSTQMMKLVFGDFFEYGEISSDFSPSTQQTIETLYNKFKGNIEQIIKFESIKLERKLGIKKNEAGQIVSLDQLQMARFLAEELEKKEAPESLRRYIQVNPDGTFKYPLDAINNRNQIEAIILNVINNKVISQKINGESYIQVAGTGFEKNRFSKPTVEQLREFGANELQFYRVDPVTKETLPMEVKIGFNYKQHGGLLKLKYREGTVETVAQLNKILESNAAIDVAWKKKHMDKLTMVGVRTPVQGFPQMEYAMVKEFLPESAGGIMILPAQIVVKSGGDFDIDKLTFYTTSYDERGETYNKTFDVKDYEAKLEQQKELKKTKQELKVLRELVEKEIASNEIFLQRQSLKDEIAQIRQEIKDAVEAVSDFIDTGYITKEDSSWAAEAASDKEDLERAFANLATFDANNDVRVLQTIATIKSNLRRINSQVDEIQVYKKSLTNELVNTLKSVLKQGELYDSLVTPNTNSVLTQYTQPGIKISTTDVFNPLTSWRIYLENILSKDALGIDAKINTLQKEFQRAGLKFINPLLNRYYFEANKDELGNIMLGGKKDARGENRISKVLSEFINGHVDIAKEDWIILLGLDQETSPLAHAMIIAGTPIENVLGFINSPIIKTLLEIGNRPEIHKKLSNIRPSKKSAILTLTNNRIKGITDPEIAKLVAKAQRRISALEIKSKNLILDIYSDVLLSNPRFSKHITEFNPSESLVGEEAAIRDLAYLLQFSVVLRQQESLRSLTSMSDFNTANYRTSFQSVELMEAESTLKEDFNSSGIDFMFKDSALAQFNVGSLVQDTMEQIYPLSDSLEVRNNISLYLSRMNVYGQEDRIKAIERYKNTLLVPYMLLTASSESKGNLLEYYRGSNGIYLRTTKNNIEERFAELLQDPDLVNNFLIRNIYIDQEGDGREVEFKLKNTDIDENSKSYRDAFLEGLNSSKPNVKSFFEDLAMGSFLQYAGVFTPGHVVNIIPHEAYVDYTEDAYTKLNDMRQQNPKLFDAYLTLVRFSAKMNAETQGPIKGLASFFVSNFTEQSKRIATLTPTVVKTLSSIESSITGVPSITTPLQVPQPTTQVQGINISTKSSDKLGRELTNPNWGAKNIMDIEAEYKANASKIKAPQLSMEEALRFDMNLMYKLQMKKFANHPELVQEITNRGGVKFLEASEHTVGVKGSRWEGKGTDSNFIKVLIRSYQDSLKTTQPAAKFTGDMTYSYGNEKRPGVIADTTFDAILSGERTATTRFEKDGNLNYWKNAKIGDIITWKAKDGRTVDVVVTKALHPLVGSGKTPEMWSKLEGWSIGRFNTKVKPLISQAYQIEFKLAQQPIKPAVVDLFNENPALASIGTPQQYSAYLDTIFPDSQVKDIVYRGGLKEDVKVFQYWTNNKAEAYMYAKANITKGGKITERNPIQVIVNNYKSYINNKYGANTFESLNLDETDYLTQVSETEYELRLPSWYKKDIQIDSSDKADFDAINTLKSTYDLIKIEDEQDLDKPYTVNNYASLKKDYDQARKQLDKYFKIEDLGEIKTAILNIKNPYKEESRQEDLQDDRDAYKNGYDGAFLADGDHFLVKSNTEQIHILGNKQDIEGFKKFVNSATALLPVKEQVIPTQNVLSTFVNHSGGATGSDTKWDIVGKEFGMVNNRHYFTGVRSDKNAPLGNVDITNQPIAVEGATKVALAAKEMWGYNYSTMKDQRLIRNWAQVANSDAVFAIGTLGRKGDIWKGDENAANPRRLLKPAVQGGTGYAVEMAIQAGKPVYVFDQVRNEWFKNVNGQWSKSDVPILTPNFAGIGTREINESGLQAIKTVYEKTLQELSTVKPGAAIEKEVIDNFEDDVDVADTTPKDTTTSFPPTKTGPIELNLKLDPQQPNDKGNLDDLGFEEDACEVPS